MDVVFLGFTEYNFDSKDGNHIEGLKFRYYFPASSPNSYGFEIGDIFVSAQNQKLIANVKSCRPGSHYNLNMVYNGRRSVFNGLDPLKSAS